MSNKQVAEFDLVGIGFGPANLSVAIHIEEQQIPLKTCFLESRSEFIWHPDMLIDGTRMQISFMKDLVTQRNPTSSYSFLNYLHQQKRLSRFINMSSFQPTRQEFNHYLSWAAKRVQKNGYNQVCYDNQVIDIQPLQTQGEVAKLRIVSQDSKGRVSERIARNILVAVGGQPRLPDAFNKIKNLSQVHSLTHSIHYKSWQQSFATSAGKAPRIAIVGAGQSAAEIFIDLVKKYPKGHVDIINRERSIHPSDDSPFVNEVFDPEFTDEMFASSKQTRHSLLQRFQGTNYAVVDMPEIEQIYQIFYDQQITGNLRHHHLSAHNIEQAILQPDTSWTLDMQNGINGERFSKTYDGIVLATGFTYNKHLQMLSALEQWRTDKSVERHYRLPMQDSFTVNIYLQGCNESSHGLSDTLLSVMAIRAQEIVADLTHNYADTATA